eukprot:COSAG06_NODE_7502_length_2482_cov_12.172801_2_plen_77_part_00
MQYHGHQKEAGATIVGVSKVAPWRAARRACLHVVRSAWVQARCTNDAYGYTHTHTHTHTHHTPDLLAHYPQLATIQ